MSSWLGYLVAVAVADAPPLIFAQALLSGSTWQMLSLVTKT